MVRVTTQIARIAFAVVAIAVAAAPVAVAESDPFAAPAGSAVAPPAAEPTPVPTQVPDPAPRSAIEASGGTCEHITRNVCSAQNKGLFLKAAGYVLLAVLLFSLLRTWWDRRGTRSAGTRFLATLLPAAALAGTLTYLDPTRGRDLACCLSSSVFASDIVLQDSALGRGVVLGVVPAILLFVLVAITRKIVRS